MEQQMLYTEWKQRRLAEVVVETERRNPTEAPDARFVYIEISSVDNATGTIVEPRELLGREAPSRARKVIRARDVIFATTRPYLGNIAVVPDRYDDQVCSTGFCVLRANRDLVESMWLYYLCRSQVVLSQVIPLMRGANYPAVTDDDVLSVEVPCPSLSVQRRIVARIEALLAEVHDARQIHKRIVEDTDRLMDAVLEETVTQLFALAPRATIKQLASRQMLQITGGGTPSKRESEYWEGNIPWVSPKDMKSWLIADTQDHITPKAVEESSAKRIPGNSVLVVVRGMILARTWPVAIAGTELTINQDMKALTPSKELGSKYLGYVLRGLTRQVLGRVETAAHGTKRLKTAIIESLEIPLPSKSEQNRVVAYLDTVQAEVQAMQALHVHDGQALGQVEQAILAQAFRGEL